MGRTSADEPKPPGELSDLLGEAKKLVAQNNLDEAALIYQELLSHPAISGQPALETEAMATLAALRLNQIHLDAPTAISSEVLEKSIDMLREVHSRQRLSPANRQDMLTQTNLALALFARFRLNGDQADLLAAHLHLDDAQDIARATADQRSLEWIASARQRMLDAKKL